MHQPEEKFWIWFIYLALTVITFAIFWQVRSFDFVNYDDPDYVSNNPHVKNGLSPSNIIWAFTSIHSHNWHPLTSLSHMLDCHLFGPNPHRHHLINLLFHILNTLLLFAVLRQITAAFWQSAFVAAVFAIHPLHVESVVWISERKDVLSTLFWLLTIAAYFHYVKKPAISRYILTLVLFTLGLMAKPMLVTLPFVLLLLDYWPINRFDLMTLSQPFQRAAFYRLLSEKIPFFALSIISSIITFLVQQHSGTVVTIYPLKIRLFNVIVSYVQYIDKMFLPTGLAVFYPYDVKKLSVGSIAPAAAILLVISILVIRYASKYRYLLVGWLWYLGTLVPVIGFVQVGSRALADRYSYVPLTGLLIIVAWAANDLLDKWKYKKIALGLSASAVILVLSVCSWFQTSCWQNSETLFTHATRATSENYMAHNNLGVIFMEQNKLTEAIEQFHLAIHADPDYVRAHYNLGSAYGKMGRPNDEVQAYKNAIKLKPDLFEAYYALGTAYGKLGRFDEQIESLKKAIKIKPDYAKAHFDLGVAYGKIGCLEDEIDSYKHAIKIKSDFIEAYNNLGVACSRIGRFQDSIQAFKQAIELKSDAPDTYYNLGAAYLKMGSFQDAAEAFKQAIELTPNDASAHFKLGLAYWNIGDEIGAQKEYETLLKLDPRKANDLLNIIQKH